MRPSNWQFSKRTIERFCTGIMVLAVLFRICAPAGPVLAVSADGKNSLLVICTAQGTKIVADPTGGPQKPEDKRRPLLSIRGPPAAV